MSQIASNAPLLIATGQNKLLARSGFVSAVSIAILFIAPMEFLGLAFPILFAISVFACAVLLAAIFYAFKSIKCPKCKLSWVRWSVANNSHDRWLHWLYEFSICPHCKYEQSSKNVSGQKT